MIEVVLDFIWLFYKYTQTMKVFRNVLRYSDVEGQYIQHLNHDVSQKYILI